MGVYPIKNLKKIRKTKFKRTKDIARKCNFTERTIQRAENGRERVSLFTIRKIAMALDLDVEEIIDMERSFPNKKSNNLSISNKNNSLSCSKFEMQNNSLSCSEFEMENNSLSRSKFEIKNNSLSRCEFETKNRSNIDKKIKAKYMGKADSICLDDGDKLDTLFFTTDIDKPLERCKINLSITMKESDFLNLVNKLYNKYKNESLQLDCADQSMIYEDVIESLSRKHISLDFEEEVIIRIIEGRYMEIVDFCPKVRFNNSDRICNLIKSLLYKLSHRKRLELTDSIIPIGLEAMDKIINYSAKGDRQTAICVKQNMMDFVYLRECFANLNYMLVNYINNKISKKEIKNEINNIHNQIISKIELLASLHELYEIEKLMDLYNSVLNEYEFDDEF